MGLIENYRLRVVEDDDVRLIFDWRNSLHIRKYMKNTDIIQFENHLQWFKNCKNNRNKILKLCLYKEKPIGLIQFNLDYFNRTGEWGFYIGEQTVPPGSGKIMCSLALDLVFHQLGMRKVCAQVLDYNVKSLSLHKKLGFHEEGRLLQQVIRDEKFIDIILFGLFKETWDREKASLWEV